MTYVKIRSWHLVDRLVPDGFHTRCGRVVGGGAPVSASLSLDERTCETCLRLARHDEDAQSTANDVVPEPGPEDATVPG
jgi:hypothetical protein